MGRCGRETGGRFIRSLPFQGVPVLCDVVPMLCCPVFCFEHSTRDSQTFVNGSIGKQGGKSGGACVCGNLFANCRHRPAFGSWRSSSRSGFPTFLGLVKDTSGMLPCRTEVGTNLLDLENLPKGPCSFQKLGVWFGPGILFRWDQGDLSSVSLVSLLTGNPC